MSGLNGKQCPRCLRHVHESVMVTDKKSKKQYLIDRCAYETCHYNFDIEDWDERDNYRKK